MKSVIGFDAEDFVGTHFEDYFHPADYAQMIPCRTLRELVEGEGEGFKGTEICFLLP